MLPLILLSAIAASGSLNSVVDARTIRQGGVVTGSGRAPPPQEHSAASRRPLHQRPRPPVRVISEFDSPDGFRPQGNPYRGVTFETATEKEIVSGPPQGDDFLERYLRRVEEQRQQRPLVSLPAPSTAIGPGAFAPNSGWQGDRETGLARPFTIRNGVVDQSPLQSPSPFSSHPTAFSPSSWLTDRHNLLQTGTRRPRPQVEVITLDNIDDWLRRQPASRPDTFNVNVATVIN